MRSTAIKPPRRLRSPADQRVPTRVYGLDRYVLACQTPGCLRVLGYRECDPSSDDAAPSAYWFIFSGLVCKSCSASPFLDRKDVAKDRAYRAAKGDFFQYLHFRSAALGGIFSVEGQATHAEARMALANDAMVCYGRLAPRWRALADQATKGADPLPTIRRWNRDHDAACLEIARRLGVL